MKNEFTMHIGLPSIMLVFTVLCLISLGVLSLAGADADRKLCRKMLDRSAAYYDACNLAEEKLCEIDHALKDAYAVNPGREAYEAAVSLLPSAFTFAVSDSQYLEMTLSYPYPDASDGAFYKLMTFQVMTMEDTVCGTGLHLIEIGE